MFNIKNVTNIQDLISAPFRGDVNAICWKRELYGDFSEIASKIELKQNITTIDLDELFELDLSENGQLARETIVNDLKVLKEHGASPVLNLIKYYERDDAYPFFPTDVYSYHVDRSPVPTDTFLCTYFGESSELLPNSQAIQKIRIPEIHNELRKKFNGSDEEFESFLTEHFFDLHYMPKPTAVPICLGIGNIWKLAVDHPESKVPPCVHRAPKEKVGENRLLLIC